MQVRGERSNLHANKAYDRSVEVWLAPARNHLPVRARFTANAGGDAFELLLRDIQSP